MAKSQNAEQFFINYFRKLDEVANSKYEDEKKDFQLAKQNLNLGPLLMKHCPENVTDVEVIEPTSNEDGREQNAGSTGTRSAADDLRATLDKLAEHFAGRNANARPNTGEGKA